MNPKNIRVRSALYVNGAVIHAVRPVVDRATVERKSVGSAFVINNSNPS